MKPRVLYDTNVMVSAALKARSTPASVVALALSGQVIPCLSQIILKEYREVLKRSKFGFEARTVEAFLKEFRAAAKLVRLKSVSRQHWRGRIIVSWNALKPPVLNTWSPVTRSIFPFLPLVRHALSVPPSFSMFSLKGDNLWGIPRRVSVRGKWNVSSLPFFKTDFLKRDAI